MTSKEILIKNHNIYCNQGDDVLNDSYSVGRNF